MAQFVGRMQGPDLDPTYVTIDIGDDDRLRIVARRRQMGSWPLAKIKVDRTSIYRFTLRIEDDVLEFFPEDPFNFAEASGAVIDLRETKGRFGLKARIEEAAKG
jgi:hypothetical protein